MLPFLASIAITFSRVVTSVHDHVSTQVSKESRTLGLRADAARRPVEHQEAEVLEVSPLSTVNVCHFVVECAGLRKDDWIRFLHLDRSKPGRYRITRIEPANLFGRTDLYRVIAVLDDPYTTRASGNEP